MPRKPDKLKGKQPIRRAAGMEPSAPERDKEQATKREGKRPVEPTEYGEGVTQNE